MNYKAKLSGTDKYKKNDFLEKRAVLPISIGNPSQDGEKLKATLILVSERFSYCDIIVADTLQRYNIMDQYSEKEATLKTREEGDKWIAKNNLYLNTMKISHKIIRWEECLRFPTFGRWLNTIKKHYLVNNTYQQVMHEDINAFLDRYKKNNPNTTTLIKLKNNSLAFFFEETAVTLSYFLAQKYHYIIYPSNIPKSIELIRKNFIDDKYPELIHNLKIYFRKVAETKHKGYCPIQ